MDIERQLADREPLTYSEDARKRENAANRIALDSMIAIKTRFSNVGSAFLLLATIFIVILGAYVVFTNSTLPDNPPIRFGGNSTIFGCEGDPCRDRNEQDQVQPLRLAGIGYLQVEFNDAALERRFPRAKVNDLKDFINSELAVKRPLAFEQRVSALESAAVILCEVDGPENGLFVTPVVLARLAGATGIEVPIKYSDRSDEVINKPCGKNWGVTTLGRPTETELQSPLLLEQAINWFTTRRVQLSDTKEREAYAIAAELLADQLEREREILDELARESATLEYGLSYRFLDAGGEFGWIIHLAVFSWFGVIASTLVATGGAALQHKYDGFLFAFVFVKFILAPLIAIIIFAIIVYSITDAEYQLSHAPIFVVLAFFSGFFSERFTNLLHEAASVIFPGMRIDKKKFDRVVRNPPARIPFSIQKFQTGRPGLTKEELRDEMERRVGNKVIDLAEQQEKRNVDREGDAL